MTLKALWVPGPAGAPIEYTAADARMLIDALLTEGVLDVAGGDLVVRQRAAGANMSVEIDPGSVAITGDDQADQGRYLARSTAVESRTVTAAPVSGSRIDLVVARVADSSITGVVDGLLLEVLTGTVHATTPVAPAVPNGAVPLARIAVGTNVVSITNANITDARPKAHVVDINVTYLSEVAVPAGSMAAAGGVPNLVAVNGYYPAWHLDPSATESVTAGLLRVPDGWSSFYADAYFVNPAASSGNHVSRLLTGTHSPDGVIAANGTAFFSIAAGAQNVVKKATFPEIAVTPGQLLMVGVERDGAHGNDTLPNDIGLISLVLRKAS